MSQDEMQLAPADSPQWKVVQRPPTPEEVIIHAIDKQVSPENLERLLAMQERIQAARAKAEFDAALSAFQAEAPVILKEKPVATKAGTVAYKFAPIEAIAVQIKPLLLKHGFSYSLDEDVTSQEGWVIGICVVTHKAGHSKQSRCKFPLGTKTDIMSNTQVRAAALTFACRRALCNAFGLVISGEDIDGATGKIKPQGPSKLKGEKKDDPLVNQMWEVTERIHGTDRNWDRVNQWCWNENILNDDERLPHLSPDRFKAAIQKAKEVLKV